MTEEHPLLGTSARFFIVEEGRIVYAETWLSLREGWTDCSFNASEYEHAVIYDEKFWTEYGWNVISHETTGE